MKTKKITVEELNGVVQIEEDLIKKGLPYFLKRCQRGEIQGAIEKNKGSVFTFGETYYYKHGRTPEALRDKVEKKLREAGYGTEALTWGDNYCTFHGGCKPMSAKDSFFWVTFIIKRKTDAAGEKQEEEKLAEDWQPQKGEEVYAFQASRRRGTFLL